MIMSEAKLKCESSLAEIKIETQREQHKLALRAPSECGVLSDPLRLPAMYPEHQESAQGVKRKWREVEMLVLELRAVRLKGEIKQVQVETFVKCFEIASRIGLDADTEGRVKLLDFINTVIES